MFRRIAALVLRLPPLTATSHLAASPLKVARHMLAVLMLIGAGCATGPLGSGDNGSSACPECIALKTMVQEYDANRLRAESKYPGRRFDVTGKIADIGEDRRNRPLIEVEVGVKARDFSLVTAEEYEYQVTTVMPFEGWSDWIIEKSKGDSVEANCLVTGFKEVWSLTDKTYWVPRLDECRRVERQSIGENAPTPTPFIFGVSPTSSVPWGPTSPRP